MQLGGKCIFKIFVVLRKNVCFIMEFSCMLEELQYFLRSPLLRTNVRI